MNDQDAANTVETEPERRETNAIRLPGFVNDDDVGLGDAIQEVTSAIGIRPCAGCERRAAALNRLLIFKGRRPK